MNTDEQYMARCIQLAGNGLGRTYPNPLVGSVIVHQGHIIGEGWHQQAGGPHAEVHALNAVKNPSLLNESTLYVSLEPCSHFGKTPPCSDRIIASGIKKVVIGTVDPFPAVAGKGIRKLMEAGCEVKVGVLEAACWQLNKRFFTYHQQHRPYIILKWAQSSDGFIAPAKEERISRKPIWISNPYSKQLVHKWRSEEQSILVGSITAIVDNPRLDTREWYGNNPVRIVLDPRQRVPEDSHLFDGLVKTIRIIGEGNPEATQSRAKESTNYMMENMDFSGAVVEQLCTILYRHSLQSVIVEGGRKTLESFIEAGLWDEARVFIGDIDLGAGIAAPILQKIPGQVRSLQRDTLRIYQRSNLS